MALKKVPLHEATPAQLRYYADTILGLADIKPQHQAATLIAKIQAANPDAIEIEVPDDVRDHELPVAQDVVDIEAAGQADTHFSKDPRVEVIFSRTNDVTKPKTIQIAVNGDVIVAKRGVPMKIPYRHYLANQRAIETVGRETDEVNETGMPVMEFADQPSYPMERTVLPPRAEIIAWHKRMGSRPSPEELHNAA